MVSMSSSVVLARLTQSKPRTTTRNRVEPRSAFTTARVEEDSDVVRDDWYRMLACVQQWGEGLRRRKLESE